MRLCRRFPIRAVLLTQLVDRTGTVLRPISAGATLRGVAPSTILQLTSAATPALTALARLIGKVPGYALEVGTDEREVPRAIAGLLERGRA